MSWVYVKNDRREPVPNGLILCKIYVRVGNSAASSTQRQRVGAAVLAKGAAAIGRVGNQKRAMS
jgi:hypothetical protein